LELFLSRQLVKHGMIVVGCARNITPIEEFSKECETLGYKGKLYARKCDLTNEEEIEQMFDWIKTNVGGIDVCINNAGFTSMTPFLELKAKEMREMVDTNVIAPVLCSNLSIASMRARGVDDGHIININSTLGHTVMNFFQFYSGTKFAVKAITEGLRKELAAMGSKIKVTQISPGRVETHFLHRACGDPVKADQVYASAKSLTPEDVTNAVLHALSAPEHVHVFDFIMQPMVTSDVTTYYKKSDK